MSSQTSLRRSLRPEIRNPVLALASFHKFALLDAHAREMLITVLREIGDDAARKAQHFWRKNKAPMAVYWKVVSVYARHIGRALKKSNLAGSM